MSMGICPRCGRPACQAKFKYVGALGVTCYTLRWLCLGCGNDEDSCGCAELWLEDEPKVPEQDS